MTAERRRTPAGRHPRDTRVRPALLPLLAALLICPVPGGPTPLAQDVPPPPLDGEAGGADGPPADVAPAPVAAALGRDLFGPGGACGMDRPGVRGKLCRLLSGALVRMTPLPDAAAAVRLDRADGVYREGDRLVVTVEVPREVGALHHLHVLYLDEAGEVMHLLPNPLARETRVGGGQRVVLGAAGRDYRVGPPYGRGVVLALLSPRPLDPVGRREGEGLGDFIAALQVALRRALAGGSSVRFAAVGLETRPR
jgi:hypothetical protein